MSAYIPPDVPGPPGCWVVVLNYKGADDTLRCVDSLAAVRSDATVLIVDNGSDDDVLAVVRRRHPWVATLANGANLGYAGGNNRGLEAALQRGARQVVLLNNDTTVSPLLVSRLAAAAQGHPEFGVIGPIISFMEEPDLVRTDGCMFNRAGKVGFFDRLEVPPAPESEPPAVTEVDIVNGCCMMVSADVVSCIGLIDERFFLVHEESDFCLRAKRAGFRCGVVADVLVWHKGSSSFARAGNGLQRYFDVRNLRLLLSKHSEATPLRRSASASWLEYLKYAYFVYSIERERGTDSSTRAVVEGLHDAATRSYGPRAQRRRPLAPILRGLLEAKRRLPLG